MQRSRFEDGSRRHDDIPCGKCKWLDERFKLEFECGGEYFYLVASFSGSLCVSCLGADGSGRSRPFGRFRVFVLKHIRS